MYCTFIYIYNLYIPHVKTTCWSKHFIINVSASSAFMSTDLIFTMLYVKSDKGIKMDLLHTLLKVEMPKPLQ